MKKRLFHPPEKSQEPLILDEEEEKEQPITTQEQLFARMQEWTDHMERLGLADYVRYMSNRKRMFWSNFMGGMARGLGMAVGFTILGALLVLFLQDLAQHNLPIIGDMIAEIVSVVQNQLQ